MIFCWRVKYKLFTCIHKTTYIRRLSGDVITCTLTSLNAWRIGVDSNVSFDLLNISWSYEFSSWITNAQIPTTIDDIHIVIRNRLAVVVFLETFIVNYQLTDCIKYIPGLLLIYTYVLHLLKNLGAVFSVYDDVLINQQQLKWINHQTTCVVKWAKFRWRPYIR